MTGKLFLGKKKKQFLAEKKKTTEKLEIDKKYHFLPFFDLFLQIDFSQLSEWRANFSWEKKKTRPEKKKNKPGNKKKQKMPKTSE